jgi:hypothetical protein
MRHLLYQPQTASVSLEKHTVRTSCLMQTPQQQQVEFLLHFSFIHLILKFLERVNLIIQF